jgi:polyhydroxybutyrate depolymerase
MTGHRALAVAVVLLVAFAACSGGDDADPASAPEERAEDITGRGSAGCGRPAPDDDEALTLDVDGVERYALLSVPEPYDPDRPAPLVLLIHGFSSNPSDFSTVTQLPEVGAADGRVVVTPEGIDGRWDLDPTGADAVFVDELVEDVTSAYCIDLDRIDVAGMSLGAAFAITYACARPGEIAAIAAVTVEFQLGCAEPISIIAFHGTEDPLVPYQDGEIGLSLPGPVRGTELNMADWAELDRCQTGPLDTIVGDEVVERAWHDCADDTRVVLYTVEGGGHTWPGADPQLAIGHTTDQVDATAEILAFFG